jgi:hypothetical protein
MEIQLPRWLSNVTESRNVQVQVAEINLKTLPEITESSIVQVSEINPITFPEINPKTLPEIKTFIDTEETGREFYNTEAGIELHNALNGQESNLPIILFGVVVIAVIIYIG